MTEEHNAHTGNGNNGRKHVDPKKMPHARRSEERPANAQAPSKGSEHDSKRSSLPTDWKKEFDEEFEAYEKQEESFNEKEEQKAAEQIAKEKREMTERAERTQKEFYDKRAQALNDQYAQAQRAARQQRPSANGAHARRSERVTAFEPAAERQRYEQAHTRVRHPLSKRTKQIIAIVAAVVLVVAVYYTQFSPMTVYVNGQQTQVTRSGTVDAAIKAANVQTTPGKLLAVDGSTLDENGGEAYSATVNGNDADGSTHLSDDAEVDVEQGADKTEDYTEGTETIPAQIIDDGSKGAVHKIVGYNDMKDGTKTTKTGNISGITVDGDVTEEPVNATLTRYNINTNGDKVVCLTFDDGPWHDTTSSILDTLEENGAVATFFIVGQRIEATQGGSDLLQRELNDGCLLCTHTYDHAEGSGKGVNISYMSDEEQVNEITNGMQAIKDATGQDVSRIVRTPGGNYPLSVAQNLAPYIDYEVDWNIDTRDWSKPGTDAIIKAVESAQPGNIILMHDGGGNRTETADAIKTAIPYLKSEGYTFLTVDQLLSKYDPNYGK